MRIPKFTVARSKIRIPTQISWKYLTDLGFSFVILGVGQFLNYLFNVNLANNLSRHDFGIFSAILALIFLLSVLATTIQNALTKLVALHFKHNIRLFYIYQLLRFAFISLLGWGIVWYLAPWLSNTTQIPLPYVRLFSLYVIVSLFTFVPRGFLLGQQKVKLTNTIIFLEILGKFIWSFWIIDATGALWAYIAPSLLSGLIFMFLPRFAKGKPVEPEVPWQEYVRIFAVVLLVQLPFSLDVLLISDTIRPSYAALVLLGKIIFFGSTIITGVMFANAAKDATVAARKSKLLLALSCTAIIGITISVLYLAFPGWFNQVVFRGEYLEIIPYLGWYGFGFTAYAIGYTCSNYLIVNNRYSQVWGLMTIVVVQIVLLLNYTTDLHQLVQNQTIIYALLGLYLLWETFANEPVTATKRTRKKKA